MSDDYTPTTEVVRGAVTFPRRRLGGDGLSVYVCHISGAWHLGHPQPGKSRDDYRKERP